MARDIFIQLNRCAYCNRPGFVAWDVDLFSCGHEVCKSLAFAEVRRRHARGRESPEKRLARALLGSLDTFLHAVQLDERAGVLAGGEASGIVGRERHETAHLLSELHALQRRYPPRERGAGRVLAWPPPNPRFRRFVRSRRTVPLRSWPQRSSEPARTFSRRSAAIIPS